MRDEKANVTESRRRQSVDAFKSFLETDVPHTTSTAVGGCVQILSTNGRAIVFTESHRRQSVDEFRSASNSDAFY